MINLTIETVESQLVVDSRLVAKDLGVEHKHFIRTIRNYKDTIESAFGQLSFENATVTNSVGAVNSVTFCYLTEDQATFVMTLSRNTEQVIQCKANLVKAFSDAKKKLDKPQTYLEALKTLVESEEEKERLRLERESLEEDNQRQAEVIDELFDYSSIIRIAKYNGVSEKNFSWRVLKKTAQKMELEIKKVPDSRFGSKNLYPHDALRYAYPNVALPETKTLRINR